MSIKKKNKMSGKNKVRKLYIISLLLFILWDLGILNPILWTSLLLITVMIDTFKI